MPHEPQVCVKTARICLLAASARGLDVARLNAAYGLDPALLADPYARLPHATIVRLWTEIPALAGDDSFGLHAAELAHSGTFDAVDGALRHAPTVGDILRGMTRYVRLLHDAASVDLTREGAVARYSQRFDCSPPPPRHMIELIAAMWVLRIGRLVGHALPLIEVALPHAAPSDLAPHRRLFGERLRFGAPQLTIVFEAALLEAPNPGAEPTLGLALDRHLRDELGRLPAADLMLALERAVREALCDGAPDVDRIARRLGQSRRSLQRRLQREGKTFQAIVDAARRALALSRLADPQLTLTEIAFLAGFSELSAFDRAFRRWTGESPRAFRRRGGGALGQVVGAGGQDGGRPPSAC